jgi:integrase
VWTDSGLVFTREDGAAIRPHSLSQLFEKEVKAAKLPRLAFHSLRHTHATLGLASGVPAKVCRSVSGMPTWRSP